MVHGSWISSGSHGSLKEQETLTYDLCRCGGGFGDLAGFEAPKDVLLRKPISDRDQRDKHELLAAKLCFSSSTGVYAAACLMVMPAFDEGMKMKTRNDTLGLALVRAFFPSFSISCNALIRSKYVDIVHACFVDRVGHGLGVSFKSRHGGAPETSHRHNLSSQFFYITQERNTRPRCETH